MCNNWHRLYSGARTRKKKIRKRPHTQLVVGKKTYPAKDHQDPSERGKPFYEGGGGCRAKKKTTRNGREPVVVRTLKGLRGFPRTIEGDLIQMGEGETKKMAKEKQGYGLLGGGPGVSPGRYLEERNSTYCPERGLPEVGNLWGSWGSTCSTSSGVLPKKKDSSNNITASSANRNSQVHIKSPLAWEEAEEKRPCKKLRPLALPPGPKFLSNKSSAIGKKKKGARPA